MSGLVATIGPQIGCGFFCRGPEAEGVGGRTRLSSPRTTDAPIVTTRDATRMRWGIMRTSQDSFVDDSNRVLAGRLMITRLESYATNRYQPGGFSFFANRQEYSVLS